MAEVMSASAIDSAQNLAGKSIVLEMGARLGVIDLLMQDEPFDAQRVVRVSGASRHFVESYLAALGKLGLAARVPDAELTFAGSNERRTVMATRLLAKPTALTDRCHMQFRSHDRGQAQG